MAWEGDSSPAAAQGGTTVRCGHCDTVVAQGPPLMAILTHFPQDLLGVYAVLAGKMGSVFCPHCSRLVDSDVGHVVLFDGRLLVLGVPEGWTKEEGDKAAKQLTAAFPDAEMLQCRGRRLFRTQVIRRGLEPAMELLRSYVLAEHRLPWVRDNAEHLDHSFFSALWLMGTGAIETFMRPVEGNRDTPVFLPSEQAPDDARHVVRKAEAVRQVCRQTGELAGWLLSYLVVQAMENRALQEMASSAEARLPGALLRDADTLDALAEHIGRFVDSPPPAGRPGWLELAYLHEAALALLCAAHEVANPRRTSWTSWYLLYDIRRRLDGAGEALLPSVETLHATLDAAAFWRQFHQHVNRSTDEDEGQAIARGDFLKALFESAGRVFPSELQEQLAHHLKADADGDVARGGDAARRRLRDVIRAGGLELRRHIAAFVEQPDVPVAEHLLDALADPELTMPDGERLGVLRLGMEYLKNHGRGAEAYELARAGLEIITLADEIDPNIQGHFLNEVGNVLRIVGLREEAIEMYEASLKLVGGDLDDADHRVALRNLGIVLRELHRYGRALEIFRTLRPKARPMEARGLVTSEALCLLETGQAEAARALMQRYIDHVEGASANEAGVLEFCTLFCQLQADAGEVAKAARMLDLLKPVALLRRYHPANLLARDLVLRGDADPPARRAAVEQQLDLLEHIGPESIGTMVLGAVDRVVAGLVSFCEPDRAERFLRHMAGIADPRKCPRGWQFHAAAAEMAAGRGDDTQGADDIDQALLCLQVGVATVVGWGDLAHFTAPDAPRLERLVAQALSCRTGDARRDERRWRTAADTLAAPALTARLRHSAALPAEADPQEGDLHLTGWLESTGGAAAQVCVADGKVVIVRTALDAAGNPRSELRPLNVSADMARSLASKLAFRLMCADPAGDQLPLHSLADWPAVSAALGHALDGLPVSCPLLVVAGVLQEAVISLAVGDRYALSFAPSLGAVVALHRRSLQVEAPVRRLFSFVTWFDREPAAPAAALSQVPMAVAEIASAYDLQARHVSGTEATREALLGGLAQADVAWIACHGRARRSEASVDLLVAAGGRLPPADLRDAADRLRDAHVVAWEALAALERAPAVVFSSACDSGLAHTNVAGERLGLERALLPAGTMQFVAPLWPVPTVATQQVVARLLDAWLDDPAIPLSVHVMRNRQWCAAHGVPPLACHALALFGLPQSMSRS